MNRESEPLASESAEVASIDKLPEGLFFVETEELNQLRGQLVEAMTSGTEDQIKRLAFHYHALGEEVVNHLPAENFPKGQIGLIVAMGLIRRDAGRIDHYIEDLQDALTYAENMGYEDVVPTLSAAIAEVNGPNAEISEQNPSHEIADKLRAIGEDSGFDPQTCDEISEMDFPDAFETAFGYLAQAGLDPEEVLAEFMG